MKFLFVDDNRDWLTSLALVFRNDNVVVAECHGVNEAIEVIQKENPDVLFLDNSLTDGGREGLEIADQIDRSIRVYSTTAYPGENLKAEYGSRGIECIGKTDLQAFISIIRKNRKE